MITSETRYPASDVDKAYNACHPEIPLDKGDPRYVDLTPVRGGTSLADRVARRIRRTSSPLFHKQLVTGHRGCGKSTELKQLQARLREEGFFAVYLDVEAVLDLGDIEYLDVLLAIARAVYEDLQQEKIEIQSELLESLDKWFAETILTDEQREDVEATLKSEFGVSTNVPLFLRFMVGITGLIRTGGSRRQQVRQKLEPELRVFLDRLNELLNDAQVRIVRKEYRGLVVIVDGLEKMHYREKQDQQTSHSVLFVQHAEQLKAPNCHVVYTVPVSLVFNSNMGDAFPETDFIPMVRITRSDGQTPNKEGRQALFDVVAKRVDVSNVFEDEDAVKNLVEASGGSVRDLLRMVRFACDETDDRIMTEHASHAVKRLEREYDFLVRDEHREALVQIARQRRASGDDDSGWLLHQRLVLEYQNDERWHDLHPVVRSNSRVREWLKAGGVT